jgi:phenylacetate-CoA ligase
MNLFRYGLSKTYYATWVPLKYAGSMAKRLRQFKENETLAEQKIDQLRWFALKRMLSNAENNVPYYHDLFRMHGLSTAEIHDPQQLVKIPLLTRADIKNQLEQLIARNIPRASLTRSGTGGSTGQPTPFYHDQEYERYQSALILRNLNWTGWKYGEPILRVWGSPFDIRLQDQTREQVTNFLKNITVLPAFNMSEYNLTDWIKQIHRIRPVIVEGYTHALLAMAGHAHKIGSDLDKLGVRAVICSAEALFPTQRALLQEAFGCQVINRYGCRELSTIAHECQSGRLHINEDWVHLEIVDANGQPVPPGVVGQVVLTGFYNRSMPFIRYAIEDVAALPVRDDPCSCGRNFRTIERLEGRIQDLIALPNGGFLAGQFFTHLLKDYDLIQFQVVQPTINTLDVLIVPGPRLGDESFEKIKRTISGSTPGIEVRYVIVDEIAKSTSGKYRVTISKVAEVSSLFAKSHRVDP